MPSSSYLSSYSRGSTGSRASASSANSAAAAQKRSSAERNQQVLRTLLNDPGNKFCGDCKTTGHPRWASWSIGVFLCIRCSGIHRSMGTHISKVRSIDLDSWSDEQIENMVKWGNKRSNLYWEHKLPDNYVPDDSKIANFIRTKYDLKRWVMDGPVPDPASLGVPEPAQNDSTPLAEVRKRLDSSTSASASKPLPPARPAAKSAPASSLIPDLLGLDADVTRSSPTVAHQATETPPAVPAKNDVKPATHRPAPKTDSLLGLDFGAAATNAPRTTVAPTASAGATVGSRPDLKKSILSLYAAAPPQPVQSYNQPIMAPMGGSTFDSLTTQTSGLNLGNPVASQAPTKPDMFGSLISDGGASTWASTPTAHARKPSNDEWASFASAPAPAKPKSGADDDLFRNVWN